MSKPKMVVLGFLNRAPMYGYQIGHVVEKLGFPVWAGIKLPSVYKALQDLEASTHIRGEQVTEGNNPPRTVFHINDKGRKLLSELIQTALSSNHVISQDWWLALSFSFDTVERSFLESVVEARLQSLKDKKMDLHDKDCGEHFAIQDLPFVHKHIMQLGIRHHEVEQKTLMELLDDIRTGNHEDFFTDKGDPI